jgi:hypothetical protein
MISIAPPVMRHALLALAALSSLAAAQAEGTLAQLYAARPPAGSSFVRVVHPDAGNLRVKIADGPEQTLSGSKPASSYAIVKGDTPFAIQLDGKSAGSMKVAPGSFTTLVPRSPGKNAAGRFTAIDDSGGSQDALKAELRFYNLSTDCAEGSLQVAPAGPALFKGVAPAASASRSINPVSAQLGATCGQAASAPISLPQLQPGDHYSLFLTGTASAPVLRGQASATDAYRP